MTYPLSFRQRVLAIQRAQGLTHQQTADLFRIGKDTITRWHRCIEPKNHKDPSVIKDHVNTK